MAWYMFLSADLPYGVSKLNCVKSAPVAARLSPLVSAPAGKQNKNLKGLCHGCLVQWIDVLGWETERESMSFWLLVQMMDHCTKGDS